MATLDLQEQEQVDAFKHWWKDNGKGVILAAGAGVGHFWRDEGLAVLTRTNRRATLQHCLPS